MLQIGDAMLPTYWIHKLFKLWVNHNKEIFLKNSFCPNFNEIYINLDLKANKIINDSNNGCASTQLYQVISFAGVIRSRNSNLLYFVPLWTIYQYNSTFVLKTTHIFVYNYIKSNRQFKKCCRSATLCYQRIGFTNYLSSGLIITKKYF